MKKKIGIIVRPVLDRLTINRELSDVIIQYGCIPIGIVPTCDEGIMDFKSYQDMKDALSLCDGVILQGGKDFYDYDIKAVQYLHENNIPTLGICLGMQTMACAFDGILTRMDNDCHYQLIDYVHSVSIEPNSKLYSILQKETIIVNSRHHDEVLNTNLYVVAKSGNVIEAVEDPNKKFFIGVEWHPESIDDDNSRKLFQSFFNCI